MQLFICVCAMSSSTLKLDSPIQMTIALFLAVAFVGVDTDLAWVFREGIKPARTPIADSLIPCIAWQASEVQKNNGNVNQKIKTIDNLQSYDSLLSVMIHKNWSGFKT